VADKMSQIAFQKLNMILSLRAVFRSTEVTIAGKYFRHNGMWNLLIHVEEGRKSRVSEGVANEMMVTEHGGWPLNTQTIVDEEYLRYIAGNVEVPRLQALDLY
jgi:hypothetical protein